MAKVMVILEDGARVWKEVTTRVESKKGKRGGKAKPAKKPPAQEQEDQEQQ